MGPDLLRRIRWGNLGRLAGALAVVAAVAAWPRLAPPQPALPDEVARPLDGLGGPAPTATPPAELIGPRPPQAVRRPRARRSRARGDGDQADEAHPRARPPRGPVRTNRPPGGRDDEGGVGAEGETDRSGASGNDAKGDGRDPAQLEFGFEHD